MTMTASKLPSDGRPLIRNRELANAIDDKLQPYSGEKLKAAQTAVRRVRASGIQAPFGAMVAAYEKAILDAVAKAKD